MSFVSAKLIKDGRSFRFAGQDSAAITRVYRVTSNSKDDEGIDLAPSMPVAYGSFHPNYPAYQCLEEDWTNEETGPNLSIWIATFIFSTRAIDQEEQERKDIPDPLDRRARVTVRSVRYGELTDRDKNGNIKRTSAGEIYEPKEKDAVRWTIHVRKNVVSIPDYMWEYQNKLNAAAVTVKGKVCPAETLKFGEVLMPELVIENGVAHYPIEFDLDFRREGWKDKRVDAGFIYMKAGVATKITVEDEDGNQVETSVAQWLDGSGGILRDTIANPQPGDETINEFDDYETADFSILPLNEG